MVQWRPWLALAFQYQLWTIFAITALVAYLLAWLVVYLAFKNDPPPWSPFDCISSMPRLPVPPFDVALDHAGRGLLVRRDEVRAVAAGRPTRKVGSGSADPGLLQSEMTGP